MRTKWLVSVELSWIKYSTDDLLNGEHSKKANEDHRITQTGSQISAKASKDNLKHWFRPDRQSLSWRQLHSACMVRKYIIWYPLRKRFDRIEETTLCLRRAIGAKTWI